MLAKELKIKTLKQQREYIKEALFKIPDAREDGNICYPYLGNVYPEVVKYFEAEGFNVTEHNSEQQLALTQGIPVWIFTVSDDLDLSEEEMKQAEECERGKKEFKDTDLGRELASAQKRFLYVNH